MRNHDGRGRTKQAECVGGAAVGRSGGLLLVDDLAAESWGPWDKREDDNTTVFMADAHDAPCLVRDPTASRLPMVLSPSSVRTHPGPAAMAS